MKIKNVDYDIDIDVMENHNIYELIIENPNTMSKVLLELVRQIKEGEEGEFVITNKGKEINYEKESEIIIDFFGFEINNKKVINKLYAKLNEIAEEKIEEKSDINSKIITVLDDITTALGYTDVDYSLEFKWIDIFKVYGLEVMKEYSSLLEKVITYIKVLADLSDVKILMLVNVKSYFDYNELTELYNMARYNGICLLLIESKESIERGEEIRYIIDKDNCFISAN